MAKRWPATLPQRVLRDGFSRSLADNRIVSDTDSDGGKSRRRSSNAPAPFRVGVKFTTNQVELFWAWWHEEIGGGTFDFWFPAPATNGLALLDNLGRPLLTDDGRAILIVDWHLVRFAPRQPPPTFEKRLPLKYVSMFAMERLW